MIDMVPPAEIFRHYDATAPGRHVSRVSGCRGSGAPPVLGIPADLGAQCSRAGMEGHHAERSFRAHGRDGRQRPILRRKVHRPGDQADRRRHLRLFLPHVARALCHHGHLGRHPRRRALSGLRSTAEASRWPRRAGGDPDHAAGPRDHRRPARGRHGQRRRNHAGTGRRLREPDGGRAAASREGAGVAGDRREGPCGVEPRLHQSRSRGEAVRTSPAAGGRRDRRQDRGSRLRHARICRVGADCRLSLRPRPAAGRGHQDLRPPHRGRSRGALRRSGRSDDPQHLARGDRRRLASGASHRSHPELCSVSRQPA